LQAGSNVLRFKVGQFLQYLGGCQPVSKEFENVNDPYPHAPDARPPAALLRVDGDAIHVFTLQQVP